MPSIHITQVSMLSGELSEYTDPRQDVGKVKEGLSRMRNMLPLPFGGAVSRPGTEFIFESGNTLGGITQGKSRLIPFIVTPSNVHVMEFSENMIRFFRNGNFVPTTEPFTSLGTNEFTDQSNGTGSFSYDTVNQGNTLQGGGSGNEAIAERSIPLSPGDYTFTATASNDVTFRIGTTSGASDIKADTTLVTGVNTISFTVPNSTDPPDSFGNIFFSNIFIQFENSNNDSRWVHTISWPTLAPYALATEYAEADLPNIRFAQSDNIMYLVDGNHRVRSMQATIGASATTFTLRKVDFIDGPFYSENIGTTTITPGSPTFGVYTLTASTGIFFDGSALGMAVRLKHSNKWGSAHITEWISATSVKAQEDFQHPYQGTGATTAWRLGKFSDSVSDLWPDNVTLFEGRLTFSKGNEIYSSMSGQFNAARVRLDPTQTDGTVADDNAFTVSLNSTELNNVQWFSPSDKLVVGTDGAEWIIKAGDASKAISPTNKVARRQSREGSKIGSAAAFTGGITLFTSRLGKKIWRIAFSFEKDAYVADDTTIFSDHITDPGIITIANQSEPYNVVWAALSDGDLATLTFSESQKVNGWARHTITGGKVEEVVAVPSEIGADDEVWMVVLRTINGNQVRYLERLSNINIRPTLADNKQLDSHLTYSGSATSTLSGLQHLEGETVQVLSDGKRMSDKVVSGGSITTDEPVTSAIVGLKYNLELDTVIMQNTLPTGMTLAGKQTRLVAVDIRLGYSVGVSYLDPVTGDLLITGSNVFQDPVIVKDQWIKIAGASGWSNQSKIQLRLEEPYFLAVLTLAPRFEVSDRRQS